MTGRFRTIKAIVIGKTKLGESDSIVRFLAEDGSKVEAVAKGARKPQSSLSGRLELFNEVEVLVADGRSLGIVKECRLISDNSRELADPLSMSSAACMAEFASKSAQVDLPVSRYFDLLSYAVSALIRYADRELLITSAFFLKATSILGMRPSLDACSICGEALDPMTSAILFSYNEGGIICNGCSSTLEAIYVNKDTISLASALIKSPFSAIATFETDRSFASDVFEFACNWVRYIMGINIKSASSLLAFATL